MRQRNRTADKPEEEEPRRFTRASNKHFDLPGKRRVSGPTFSGCINRRAVRHSSRRHMLAGSLDDVILKMDRISVERRSALMSRIRSKDTKPELVVRRLLHRLGYRYVLHDARLPGRPDLVFPSRRKAIFVHGCFWHGHSCPRGFKPTSNVKFWEEKMDRNRGRDRNQARSLRALGWRVLTVWECATQKSDLNTLTRRLVAFLNS